jgi:hypothetical protein
VSVIWVGVEVGDGEKAMNEIQNIVRELKIEDITKVQLR